MAVPASGQITLAGLRQEENSADYTAGAYTSAETKLGYLTTSQSNDWSDAPDQVQPYKMTEFYGKVKSGVTNPTSVTYTALSTTSITFTFTEPTNASRVYFYQGTAASAENFANQQLKFDDATYISVNESGNTSVTFAHNTAGDEYYSTDEDEFDTRTLEPNDYMDVKFKGWESSTFATDYTTDIRGWTLPDVPTSLAQTITPTVSGVGGDNTSGAYTKTMTWAAPTNGGASSYVVTHGPHSTRGNNNASGSDVAVSGTSLAVTGINNLSTQYWWIRAKGGGNDLGAWSGMQQTSILGTYWTSEVSNFTISGAPSGDITSVNYSGVQTTTVVNKSGNHTMTLTGNSSQGTLRMAMASAGDPGVSGTGNSGTGWVAQGSTCTLTPGAGQNNVYLRFEWTTPSSPGTYARTCTLTNNGINQTFTISCVASSK